MCGSRTYPYATLGGDGREGGGGILKANLNQSLQMWVGGQTQKPSLEKL